MAYNLGLAGIAAINESTEVFGRVAGRHYGKDIGFEHIGMGRFFTALTFKEALESGIEFTKSFGGIYDKDPNAYENIGSSLGNAVGAGGIFGVTLYSSLHHWRRKGMQDAFKIASEEGLMGGNAGIWKVGANGTLRAPNGKFFTESSKDFSSVMKTLKKNGTKGKWSTSKGFMKGLSGKRELGLNLGALAIGAAVGLVAGYAGKLVDESNQNFLRSKYPQYDNRFFDTREQDMSSYQQLGAAMNTYHNRMVSTARIFHSRG